MRVPPGGITGVLPEKRPLNYFKPGNLVWVLWEARWHKAVVTDDTPEWGPEVYVHCEDRIGTNLYDGYGLLVGPCSDEIWPRVLTDV